jgi:hypothetical protein
LTYQGSALPSDIAANKTSEQLSAIWPSRTVQDRLMMEQEEWNDGASAPFAGIFLGLLACPSRHSRR